jgi:hypothetical protein
MPGRKGGGAWPSGGKSARLDEMAIRRAWSECVYVRECPRDLNPHSHNL